MPIQSRYVGSNLSDLYATRVPTAAKKTEAPNQYLGKAMKVQMMTAAATLANSRPQETVCLLSDNDDDFNWTAVDSFGDGSHGSQVCTSNKIYAYQYMCPFFATAHMAKNGSNGDKVYDKEFISDANDSIMKKDLLGPEGWTNQSLLCNQLDIHLVQIMRDTDKHSLNMKKTYPANGRLLNYHVFV